MQMQLKIGLTLPKTPSTAVSIYTGKGNFEPTRGGVKISTPFAQQRKRDNRHLASSMTSLSSNLSPSPYLVPPWDDTNSVDLHMEAFGTLNLTTPKLAYWTPTRS